MENEQVTIDAKKRITYRHPELGGDPRLPLNVRYAQIYTSLLLDEELNPIPEQEVASIHVKLLRIPEVELYPSLTKPISKMLKFPANGVEK